MHVKEIETLEELSRVLQTFIIIEKKIKHCCILLLGKLFRMSKLENVH